MGLRAQGAIVKPSAASARRSLGRTTIESGYGTTAGALVGQGATEYLVLLAVVLIVALVSVALLGFFPGMAGDSQVTQSQTYWQSAQPISVTEWAAFYSIGNGNTMPYFHVRNSGAYPIRITGVVGGDGGKATQFWTNAECGLASGWHNISDNYYLGPGAEAYFGMETGLECDRQIFARVASTTTTAIGGAAQQCANSTVSPGTLAFNSFGFEYIEYIEGQQITKRQIGKQVIIKCKPAA